MNTFDRVKRALGNHPTKTYREIAKSLRLNPHTTKLYVVRARKSQPNLRKHSKASLLEEILRKNPEIRPKDLAQTYGFSSRLIYIVRKKLALANPLLTDPKKCQEIEEALRANPNSRLKELSQKLGVSTWRLSRLRKKLGVSRKGAQLSAQEKETLIQLRHLSDQKIAKILHRCPATISKVRKKLGLRNSHHNSKVRRPKVHELYHKGLRCSEIAAIVQAPIHTIRKDLKLLKKKGFPLRAPLKARILQEYQKGKDHSQIAKDLECSNLYTRLVLKNAGLRIPKPRIKVSEEEKKTIVHLLQQNLPLQKVAQHTKRSHATIYTIAASLNPPKIQTTWEEKTQAMVQLALKNTPVEEIAQSVGETVPVTIERLNRALPFRHRPETTPQ